MLVSCSASVQQSTQPENESCQPKGESCGADTSHHTEQGGGGSDKCRMESGNRVIKAIIGKAQHLRLHVGKILKNSELTHFVNGLDCSQASYSPCCLP